MEGYLLRKTDHGVLAMKKFVRRYVVVDYVSAKILVFVSKIKNNDDIDLAERLNLSEKGKNRLSLQSMALPEDVIEFDDILEVTWIKDRKDGRRFNICYRKSSTGRSERSKSTNPSNTPSHSGNQRNQSRGSLSKTRNSFSESENSHGSKNNNGLLIAFCAESDNSAREWVRAITKGIGIKKALAGAENKSMRNPSLDSTGILGVGRNSISVKLDDSNIFSNSSSGITLPSDPKSNSSSYLSSSHYYRGRSASPAKPRRLSYSEKEPNTETSGHSRRRSMQISSNGQKHSYRFEDEEKFAQNSNTQYIVVPSTRHDVTAILNSETKIRTSNAVNGEITVSLDLLSSSRRSVVLSSPSPSKNSKRYPTAINDEVSNQAVESEALRQALQTKPNVNIDHESFEMKRSISMRKRDRNQRMSFITTNILITPFKQSIWELIQLYWRKYGDAVQGHLLSNLHDHSLQLLKELSKKRDAEGKTQFIVRVRQSHAPNEHHFSNNLDLEEMEPGVAGEDRTMNLSDSDGSMDENLDNCNESSVHEDELTVEQRVTLLVPRDSALEDGDAEFSGSKDESFKGFRKLVSTEDLIKIKDDMKKTISRCSIKYDFHQYDGLVRGKDIFEWLMSNCELFPNLQDEDARVLIEEFLRKDLISLFPRCLKSTYRKLKSEVKFNSEAYYSFTETQKSREMDRFRISKDYQNFDFWAFVISRDLKPLKIKTGLLTSKAGYTKQSVVTFLLTQVDENLRFCKSQEEASLIFDLFVQNHILVPLKDGEVNGSKLNSDDLPYQFNFEVFDSRHRRLDSSSTEEESRELGFKLFLGKVLSSDFPAEFVRHCDDSSILENLLYIFRDEAVSHTFSGPQNHVLESPSSEEHCTDKNYSMGSREHANILFELLIERSLVFKIKLLKVFKVEDPKAQGYAIDVFWELIKYEHLRNHVCSNTLQCPTCKAADEEFNHFIENVVNQVPSVEESFQGALIGTMLDFTWSPQKPVALNQEVIRPGVWKSYFCFLRRVSMHDMDSYLRDAFLLVVENSSNAIALARQSNWFNWIIPYALLDEYIYGESVLLAKNLIARVLLHVCATGSQELFTSSILALFESLESDRPVKSVSPLSYLILTYELLLLFAQKLTSFKARFLHNLDLAQAQWANIFNICKLVTTFLLCSLNWGMDQSAFRSLLEYGLQDGNPELLSKLDNRYHGFHFFEAQRKYQFLTIASILEKILEFLKSFKISANGLNMNPNVDVQEKNLVLAFEPYQELFQNTITACQLLQRYQSNGTVFPSQFISYVCKRLLVFKRNKKKKTFIEEELQVLLEKIPSLPEKS